MRIVRSLTAAASVGLWLMPLSVPAIAQSDLNVSDNAGQAAALPPRNEVTIGGGWLSNSSAFFGRYNGHPDRGWFGLGGFHLEGGDAWDSGGTNYWSADGRDLGFDTRSFDLRFGQHGTWGVTIYYDGIPYWGSNTARSIWTGSGALVPGVAPGGIRNTSLVGTLLAPRDISTQRDIFGIMGKYRWGEWTINGAFRHDHKEGYQANSVYFGSAPVSPTTANLTTGAFGFFGMPINYDIDRYDLTAEYDREDFQVSLGYSSKHFTDNTPSIRLLSPFAFTSGYGGPAANVAAVYSLPPSNSAHQIDLQAGYNLTPTTRVNVNVEYGLMLQDAAFVPVTGNTNLPSIAEPRSSLDGAIQTFYGNIAVSARPLSKLDVRLSYTIDDRENVTSRHQYRGYVGDTAPTPVTFPPGDFNLPLTYRSQTLKVEAGYRLAPETRISLLYAFDDTHRSYADTIDVTQNSVTAKLRGLIIEGLFGAISYTHADRVAHNYNLNGPFIGLTGNALATNDFAGLMKFYEASRIRDEVKGTLDISPLHNLSIVLETKFRNDDYPKSILGMRNNYNLSAGPDVNWQVSPSLNVHAYYTYERYYFEQNGVYFTTSTCNKDLMTISATCNGLWNGKTTDDSHTAGLSVDWQATQLLKISGQYDFNYGNAAYSIANGGLLALGGVANASLLVAPGPNVRTVLNTFTLRAEYKLRPNISLLGGYVFANFSDNDYAYNQSATQYTNGLFSGERRPEYNLHMLLAMVRANW